MEIERERKKIKEVWKRKTFFNQKRYTFNLIPFSASNFLHSIIFWLISSLFFFFPLSFFFCFILFVVSYKVVLSFGSVFFWLISFVYSFHLFKNVVILFCCEKINFWIQSPSCLLVTTLFNTLNYLNPIRQKPGVVTIRFKLNFFLSILLLFSIFSLSFTLS